MSRPGYWRMANGTDAPIADMQEAHLRNSLRLLARRYQENQINPSDAEPMRQVKLRRLSFYSDKLIELAEEAQRRGGILPEGDIGEEQLRELVLNWPTAHDPQNSTAAQIRAASAVSIRYTTVRHVVETPAANEALAVANLPPKRLGVYLNVIYEVEQIIALPVFGLGEGVEPNCRRIELDL